MENTSTGKYRIQGHESEFYTVLLSDGGQVLLVPVSGILFAKLSFDCAGHLSSVNEEEVIVEATGGVPVSILSGGIAVAARFGAITVLGFAVQSYGIGIRRRPEELDEFLADPVASEPDEHFRQRMLRKIHDWDDQGRFVLMTPGKDYWMNADGSVFAT